MALVEPVIARESYELIAAEYIVERGRAVLRLFIDTIPPSTPERGVSVEDCTTVSRLVSDLLDVEDVIPSEYNLEVSSPGMFRPLTKPAHFERALGERVRIKTYEKLEGRKAFTGKLEAHGENEVHVVLDDGSR
ncbi:MAG: ribosome maturation factor RimP, partial [Myxococcales bacterium]|nr:ribosome maturation factor RimP [Myxococcales bacterium]